MNRRFFPAFRNVQMTFRDNSFGIELWLRLFPRELVIVTVPKGSPIC
jgi:hypothetical protein